MVWWVKEKWHEPFVWFEADAAMSIETNICFRNIQPVCFAFTILCRCFHCVLTTPSGCVQVRAQLPEWQRQPYVIRWKYGRNKEIAFTHQHIGKMYFTLWWASTPVAVSLSLAWHFARDQIKKNKGAIYLILLYVLKRFLFICVYLCAVGRCCTRICCSYCELMQTHIRNRLDARDSIVCCSLKESSLFICHCTIMACWLLSWRQ